MFEKLRVVTILSCKIVVLLISRFGSCLTDGKVSGNQCTLFSGIFPSADTQYILKYQIDIHYNV